MPDLFASLIAAGFTPESAAAAVEADDLDLLRHEGRYQVRLTPHPVTVTVHQKRGTLLLHVPLVSGGVALRELTAEEARQVARKLTAAAEQADRR